MASGKDSLTYEEVIERMDEAAAHRVYWIAAVITALGGFLFGYDTGVIGSALIYVTPYFHLTPLEVAILTAFINIFAGIGALVAGPFIDRYGRKTLLIIDGAIYAIFAFLSAIAITSIDLIIWRSLVGFAIGADTAVATGYISEFAPKRYRGRLAIWQQLMIFAGITVSFWAGFFLSHLPPTVNWRWMFGLGVIPAIILIALRFYLPESPRWLLIQGREEDAKRSLARLGIHVKEHIIPPKRELGFKEALSKPYVRRVILIIGLWLVFQQVTGVNIILYYGPYIYKYLGIVGPMAILYTAISESLGAFEYWLSYYLIDRWGRRLLGKVGYSGLFGSLILMTIGAYFFYHHMIWPAVYSIFSAATLFLFFFHIGVGGVGWVLQGETMPTEFRGRGGGILAAIDWFANFSTTYIFPIWLAAYGMFSFWILEDVLALAAVIYVLLLVPETKGLSVDQMPQLFSKPLLKIREGLKES